MSEVWLNVSQGHQASPSSIGLLNFSDARPVGDASNGGLEELHHVAGQGASLIRENGVHHTQLLQTITVILTLICISFC